MRSSRLSHFVSITLLSALFVTYTFAQSTAFNYQGNLDDGGAPANGSYDFEFLLFDQLSGGSQVGSTVTASGVDVVDGAFSVTLDFGNQFPGDPRWLEIRVSGAAPARETAGGLTILTPRQQIGSVPYAMRSTSSGSADSATVASNSLQLGGVDAAQFVVTTDPRLSDARNPLPGSGDYIQNGTSQQASSNFFVSGNGTAGGTLSAETVNATTQYSFGGNRVLSVTGTENLFVGHGAGQVNSPGDFNAFFGFNAGSNNTYGSSNTYVGARAGSLNEIGAENSFLGTEAGYNNTGSYNSFFGRAAGLANTSGNHNSFFGWGTGISNTTGNNNTALGDKADFGSGNLYNSTSVGARSFVTQSNSIVLGSINGLNGADSDTNVGIGTTAPSERLHVVGNGLFTGSLTVNGTLNATLPIGSGSYIQNSTTQQSSSNFNISGNGTAGGTLSADIANATSMYQLAGSRILGAPGTGNLFAGLGAGDSNTTGSQNAYFGTDAGGYNTEGGQNAMFGYQAGRNTNALADDFPDGSQNAFFGFQAGYFNVSGSGNTFLGFQAGYKNSTHGNTFVGEKTGYNNTSGGNNTFIGREAGFNVTTGQWNSLFGTGAGLTVTTGARNTMLGYLTDAGSADLLNGTAVGFRAYVTQSNSLILGSINGVNGSDADTNVGIGTTAPKNRLHVNGAIQVTGPRVAPAGNAVTLSSETDHDLLQSWGNRPLSINGLGNNVGIGTTSPSAQLEVVGNGIFTGNLTVNGSLNAALPTGSGSYIQNSTSQQVSSDFNIDGTGKAGVFDAASYFGIGGSRVLGASGTSTFVGLGFAPINTGNFNSFFGYQVGEVNTTGYSNSFFGTGSGNQNSTGFRNSFFGVNSGGANATGTDNSFFGFNAGGGQESGNANTGLGAFTNVSPNIDNATAVGSYANVTQSNSLVLGRILGTYGATEPTKVGIGTAAPAALLHIAFPSSQVLIGDPACGSGIFGGIGFDTTLDCTNYALLGRSIETMINVGTGGTIYFREGNTTQIRIKPGGILRVDNLGSAGSTSICRNASLEISTCSSSARYKSNIESFRSGSEILNRLRPVTFNWKDSGALDLGLVAEEVADIDPLLVTYNAAGQVEGVKYDRIGVVLVNVVKEQQSLLQIQNEKLSSLRDELKIESEKGKKQGEELDKMKAELVTLKALICKAMPEAAPCRQ